MSKIKTWEELTIQDNFLFEKVMRNKRLCKYLIEKILNIRIKTISFPEIEKTIDIRIDSHGIRLDVYVEDDMGKVYDIEMQCEKGKDAALPKRSRYYQGQIDLELLPPGMPYDILNPQYVIFICTFDLFGKGLPIYTFRNRCLERNDLELGDETTKIFLNCKGDSKELDPDIRSFLRYVDGHTPEGQFTEDVAEEVKRVKEHKETRREYMKLTALLAQERREGIEQGREEGREEGVKQGEERFAVKMTIKMLKEGNSMEKIAKFLELPLQKVREIAQQNNLI